jgi:hypothetical protein
MAARALGMDGVEVEGGRSWGLLREREPLVGPCTVWPLGAVPWPVRAAVHNYVLPPAALWSPGNPLLR